MSDFEFLGLAPETLRAVEDAGYKTPTPIQAQAIPSILQGRDIMGIAQTGTGKTAGFTLPMIDILAQGRARARMPRSLILEPTRELAAQVSENFETYGKYHKLTMALLIGGVSFADQERKLDRGVDVLVATPGRLLDHFERGKLMMSGVEILVVDEADRMLDMGFIPDVERICSLMPQKHQTLFFSATMPREIKRLADQFLTDPKMVETAPPASPAETVAQFLCSIKSGEPRAKREKLRQLIQEENVKNAIIFCNRKRDVDVLFRSLKKHGFSTAALHGDMAQAVRMETLDQFKNDKVRLLIASDVAARGLDIPAVSHVFNFDVPSHAEDYIHRIGRTGRAGLTGRAFMLATPADGKWLKGVEDMLGRKIDPVEKAQRPSEEAPAEQAAIEEAPAEQAAIEEAPAEQAAVEEAPAEQAAREERADAPPKKRRRRRKPKSEKPAQEQEQETAQASREDRPKEKRGRQKDSEKKSKQKRDDSGPVVGMGDHVPAFLARPVDPEPKPRKRKTASAA